MQDAAANSGPLDGMSNVCSPTDIAPALSPNRVTRFSIAAKRRDVALNAGHRRLLVHEPEVAADLARAERIGGQEAERAETVANVTTTAPRAANALPS